VLASITGVADGYLAVDAHSDQSGTSARLSGLTKVQHMSVRADILICGGTDTLNDLVIQVGTIAPPYVAMLTHCLQGPLSQLVPEILALVEDTPRVPLCVYHAVNDDIVPYPPAAVMAGRYCANCATIEFVSDVKPSTQHFTMELLHFQEGIIG
jgi:hypothetical protein